jgi:hypothetical protein
MTDVFSGGKQRGPTEAEVKELMPRSGGWRSRKINLFDETGAIRERFVLDASQTKALKHVQFGLTPRYAASWSCLVNIYYPNIQTTRCFKVKRAGRLVQIQ